jgi:hypothetical protein
MKYKKIPKFKCCGGDVCTCDKEIRIYFCPKCNSHNVRYVFRLGNLFGVIPKQKCLDCGFESENFPIWVTSKNKIEEAKKRLKKKINKNKSKQKKEKK